MAMAATANRIAADVNAGNESSPSAITTQVLPHTKHRPATSNVAVRALGPEAFIETPSRDHSRRARYALRARIIQSSGLAEIRAYWAIRGIVIHSSASVGRSCAVYANLMFTVERNHRDNNHFGHSH
ncbi:MAG: hypothetical protein IPH13_21445 [Planctomycetes bacterium]|nr:hypothetical protein [Planctomycetota bacterium]